MNNHDASMSILLKKPLEFMTANWTYQVSKNPPLKAQFNMLQCMEPHCKTICQRSWAISIATTVKVAGTCVPDAFTGVRRQWFARAVLICSMLAILLSSFIFGRYAMLEAHMSCVTEVSERCLVHRWVDMPVADTET